MKIYTLSSRVFSSRKPVGDSWTLPCWRPGAARRDRRYYEQNPDGVIRSCSTTVNGVWALQNQSVEGAHRWNQAKESSRFADELNENGLEQGYSRKRTIRMKARACGCYQWDQASLTVNLSCMGLTRNCSRPLTRTCTEAHYYTPNPYRKPHRSGSTLMRRHASFNVKGVFQLPD